jgi:ATP-binding cassette subfamily F protein 3
MSILSAQNLGLSHGDFDVFTGISFSLPQDARVGLVGPNGIGKTTLLQILAGVVTPTTGSVHRARDRRLGYLRQEAMEAFTARTHSIYAEMLTVFAGLLEQAAALRALEQRMAEGDHSEEMLTQYSAAQERFEHAGGYEYDVRIAQVLEGLGFPRTQWETPLNTLSGGQKTRVLLARLLLEAPDLLILDEPTNHLDIQAVEWLESTLRTWKGALLLVSHDRYFLDRVVDRVWEMSREAIESYRGNYSAYVTQRQERWERRQQLYEETKERLEKDLELIRRYFAWRKFDEAHGKLKRLGRELLTIERFGIEEAQGKSWSETDIHGITKLSVAEAHERIKALRSPVSRPPRLSMRLGMAARGGNIVVRTTALRVGYPSRPLFTAEPIELHRQECAALIGPNGAGKTTFLRTILEQIPPLSGQIRLGANLKIGYFAQAHEALDAAQTVIDAVLDRYGLTPGEARDHLAQYLFRGDDVWKRIGALSGGERGRLALALLALEGANFLLLDEPTNHLDIPAQEVLQEGLERFEGTLLLVSHDRYLVDRLATQIWDIQDGVLHVFQGSYQEFLAERERRALESREAAAQTRQAQQAARSAASPNGKEARRRAQAIASLEERIAATEALMAEYERKLQEESEAQRYEEVRLISEDYAVTQATLSSLMDEWLALAAEA